MTFQDWPLVIFTILAQLSVGFFVVFGMVRYAAAGYESSPFVKSSLNRGWAGAFALMVLALVASLTHLGNPRNAAFTILGMGTAWLSREILFALIFTLFAGLVAFLNWRVTKAAALSRTLFILGTLAGIALIYSMSMIYRYIDTQPAWSTPWTTIMFFLTAGLLGSMAVAVVLSAGDESSAHASGGEGGWPHKTLRAASVAAMIFICLDVLVYFIYLLVLFNGIPAARETASLISGTYVALFSLKVLLSMAGAVLVGLLLLRIAGRKPRQVSSAYGMACGAFALVLAAAVIGRYLFYAARIRIGI